MASRPNWTGSFLSGDLTNNYNAPGIMSQTWGGSATADSTASYASGFFGSTGFSGTSDIVDYSEVYSAEGAEALKGLNLDSSEYFQSDVFSGAAATSTGWTFITTPDEISWSSNSQVERQTIFGTNTPPVVVGTRGMRDLTLSNALVEGFSRLRTVEDKVIDLENLQNFSLNGSAGFVNVPVYQVWANSKKYGFANGTDGGYFVIESVSVKETMRDLDGNATRAFVDVKLIQVPAYQVDSGRDQASSKLAASRSALVDVGTASNQGVGASGGTGTTNAISGAAGPSRSGSGSTSTPSNSNITPRDPRIDSKIYTTGKKDP
jgi:hypothetical protein